jgi:hypothetical protein
VACLRLEPRPSKFRVLEHRQAEEVETHPGTAALNDLAVAWNLVKTWLQVETAEERVAAEGDA